jgi:hypothetical protein
MAATLTADVPPPFVAGDTATLSLTLFDPYDNVATGYRGTVHFSSTDPRNLVPPDYTFTAADAAKHTFPSGVTLTRVGPQSVTAIDVVNAALTATTSAITVVPGPAATLQLNGLPFPPGPIPAFLAQAAVVGAFDRYGNIATGYTGTVHFTSTDPLAMLPADYQFTGAGAGLDNGFHMFTVRFVTAGTQTLTVVDTANASLTAIKSGLVVTASGVLTISQSATTVSSAPLTLNGGVQYPPSLRLGIFDINDGRQPPGHGWSVTATLSNLQTGDGPQRPNHVIPAGDVSWDPTANGGCHVTDPDGDGLPDGLAAGVHAGPGGLFSKSPIPVTLDSSTPASLCVAPPGSGQGSFEDQPSVQLRVPASTAAGTYQGILTIVIS